MYDIEDIARLVTEWRDFITKNLTSSDEFSREAGYRAGLSLCADQLEEMIARVRQDTEV
jgi:hypothetical protein